MEQKPGTALALQLQGHLPLPYRQWTGVPELRNSTQKGSRGLNERSLLAAIPDPPAFDPDDLYKFSQPVVVRVGQNAAFKLGFAGEGQPEARWCRDGRELQDGGSVKLVKEPAHSRLLLRECLRSDSGEISVRITSEFGSAEAKTTLTVLGKLVYLLAAVQ